ncbi:MAG TPA: succinylglutamate desuccinylase/aspartoacylase family protein [Gammaproteobacteria bacterium]
MARESSNSLRYSKRLIDVTGLRDIVQRRIPVMKLDSRRPGPVVWLTACIHGDEPGGTAIVQDVFRKLRKVGLECGSLHALPLINSTGFENVSRYINAEREDLNRCFPGNAKGTAGERIARRIFDLIAETDPALVVDLHNDWIQSVPYVVLEPRAVFSNSVVRQRATRAAAATGLLVVQESANEDTTGTLTGALAATGVPAFTIEAGGACGIVESGVRSGKTAILGVLRQLGMSTIDLDDERKVSKSARVFNYTNQPLCTSTGIIRFSVEPGEAVDASQEIGRVYSAFGSLEERLYASRPGYVLGISDHARALPGSEVIAIAEYGEPTPAQTANDRERRTRK